MYKQSREQGEVMYKQLGKEGGYVQTVRERREVMYKQLGKGEVMYKQLGRGGGYVQTVMEMGDVVCIPSGNGESGKRGMSCTYNVGWRSYMYMG